MNFLVKKFRETSLKNKMFFSSLAVIMLLSLVIALFTRWVLITSLTDELKLRGIGIADGIAQRCRSGILTKNIPELTSLIFEARLGERQYLIAYILIMDKQDQILAHTFIDRIPDILPLKQVFSMDDQEKIRLLEVNNDKIYNISTPVNEGIYRLGTVHVGLKKEHIDNLIGKLRTTFLGFLSAITILFFIISHWLSKYITNPISQLTAVFDKISTGKLDIENTSVSENSNGFNPLNWENNTKGVQDEVIQLARSFNNMTEQLIRSQQELKDSEGKYRSLFISGPNPIFVLDRKTLQIFDANPSAEEAFGYSRAELIGQFFTDFGSFEYEDQDLAQVANSGWPEAYIMNFNVRYYPVSKSPFYLRVRACPADYKNRQALILAVTDITEMVEKDAQLIQASKMTTLGEMSAGVAHELNQPLNAIKIGNEYLELMIDRGLPIPKKELHQVATEVSKQVRRASEIINRLREFGYKTGFAKESVNINDPVRGVLQIIGKQMELENIRITLNLETGLPSILAHNNRLEQVIFNLLTNARDALNSKTVDQDTPYRKTITISTFMENSRVALSISDNGSGIPEENLNKIFQPFFTTKEVGKGMGLGLSIIYGIVKDYGGEIFVDSRLGTGTTFLQTFPIAPA
ncbi:MAG: ATP-binding protein [Pseudomonadota bacterium]